MNIPFDNEMIDINETKRIYGEWAGDEQGTPEDKTHCIEEVWPNWNRGGGWIPYQCQRKRGHGKDGLYCKQHARMHGRDNAARLKAQQR